MPTTPHYRPTRAEHEIIVLMLTQQLPVAEIALRRKVRRDTVYKQLSALYVRTGTDSHLRLADWAYRHRDCCLSIGQLVERALGDS